MYFTVVKENNYVWSEEQKTLSWFCVGVEVSSRGLTPVYMCLSVSVPVIKVPPQSQVNGTGSSLVFLCEVFAFPMALVEWRKEGRDVILPGDDPHISVQVRQWNLGKLFAW